MRKLSFRICMTLFNYGAQATLVVSAVLGVFYFMNWFFREFDALGDSHPIAGDSGHPDDFPSIDGSNYREVAEEYFKKDRSYGDFQRLWEEVVQAGDFNTENLGQRLVPKILSPKDHYPAPTGPRYGK